MSAYSHGIAIKKRFGQHFLRKQSVVEHMLDNVSLDQQSSVFEIGCGDGFLTKEIIKHPFARLWIFEIDPEWAELVKNTVADKRTEVFLENILDVNFERFEPYKPWTLLANLPYQVTFPILHLLQKNRHLLKEGVIMVQEEVAQKIVKTSGRGYGFPSLFFQYFFEWKMLEKIPPTAFLPPPKVFSRLLYFKPKDQLTPIPDEADFWKFIKLCFLQPRRTLKNNLAQTHFNLALLSEDLLKKRAQELQFEHFLEIWQALRAQ
ncbi:MAG: 16S rRNA (adenine(1518)-N(6)/adenine(1519)-N(6))-dimethyltransferase RsmA [Candidatus Dependentiae bacterium]